MVGDSLSRALDLSRPDATLLALPLLFAGVYRVGTWAFDLRVVATAVAAVACCLLIADGLFWHPPHSE